MKLPPLPACGAPAVRRIEIYAPKDGRAHGDLIASYYACGEHRRPALDALGAAKLTPYPVPQPGPMGSKRCGDGFDFTSRPAHALTAPVVEHSLVPVVDEQPVEPAPVGRRTAYDLVHAGIVAAGLPVPEAIFLYSEVRHLVVTLDDPAGVDRWAAWLGMPPATLTGPLQDGRHRAYLTRCSPGELPALPGWSAGVSCSVSVAGGSEVTR